MKKWIILLFLNILLVPLIYSQTVRDSSYKNEFGIDMIPTFKVLSGYRFPSPLKFNIQYKRKIKGNLYLRSGLSFIGRYDRTSSMQIYPDSVYGVSVVYSIHLTKARPVYDLGLEYKWGRKSLKYFAGLDLGYSRSEKEYTEYYGKGVPFKQQNISSYGPEYITGRDSIIASFTEISNNSYITAFGGLQYHFTKRMFFSLQLGLRLRYTSYYYSKKMNVKYKKGAYAKIDTENFGIINNFSFCYRF
jgi:hypothetical protein